MTEPPPIWKDCIEFSAMTDVGMRRANNQDAHGYVVTPDMQSWLDRGHLFIVADGMGAHAAGELASKLAVDNVTHLYLKHKELSPPEAARLAIRETNLEIHRRGKANVEFDNMGTTCSSLLLLPQGALVAHVGDSRVYRLREDHLQQLTFDHSLVWELRAAGREGTDAKLPKGVPSNVITRSLGPRQGVNVDVEGPLPIHTDDVYLLCSDGLSGPVKDEELGAIISALPPEEAAQALIDLANLRGGSDNITLIVIKILGGQLITGSVPCEPLTIGGRQFSNKTHPIIWILTGLFFALTFGLVQFNGIAAIVSLVISGLLGIYGGMKQAGLLVPGEVPLTGGKKLGRGPHTNTHCPANEKIVASLSATVAHFEGKHWKIDWAGFHEYRQKAEAAAAAKDYKEAVAQYCHSISFVMKELRTIGASSH